MPHLGSPSIKVQPHTEFKDPFSQEVWASTYKDHNDKNIDDTLYRVAKAAASVEKTPELKQEWTQKFYDLLSNFKATAGGRIYANAGTQWGGTTLMNCFSPDVEVITSSGPKKICDVEIGDFVLTHKGRYRRVDNTMSRYYSGPVQRFSSKFFSGDIISTPEHPFYQSEEIWITSSELEKVVLAQHKAQPSFVPVVRIDLADVLSDHVALNRINTTTETLYTIKTYVGGNGAVGIKHGHTVRRFIYVKREFAYLLGRFVADGCTFKNNRNSLFEADAFNIAYNSTTERTHAELMVSLFQEVFGITPNLISSSNNTTYVRKASQIVAESLRRLVGGGHDTKFIPETIWSSSPDIQTAFLVGLFDGDGFVTERGEVQIELTNPRLLQDVQTLMIACGIPCSLNGKRLSAGASFTDEFRKNLSKVYQDDRLSFRVSKPATSGPVCVGDGMFAIRPERNDEQYDGYVYNISVNEDESYVVNNVIVHNCYVGPRVKYDIDSLDGILQHLRSQTYTLKSEGGWGENFSYIRPRGSFIHGIGVETPGAVKYMELFDKSSDIITAGSGRKSKNKKAKGKIRKGAMMGVMDVWHPDIIEFITAKQQPGRLTKFNVSVNCTDEFMQRVINVITINRQLTLELEKEHPDQNIVETFKAAIQELDTWNLRFPDTTFEKYKEQWDGNLFAWEAKGYPVEVHNTVSVLWLWNLIMESTYNRAEPGVLFLDRANYFLPLNYAETVFATNPCGEQTLAPGGVCNLASLNLTQFVNKDRTGFDLESLKTYTRYIVRFLDDINDLTKAPLPEYEESIRKKRRIGVGILGWGSALYMLKTRFASERANELRDSVMRVIAQTAYMSSIDLAEEKGMFEYCTPKWHADGPFIRQLNLPEEYMNKLRKTGIRNSSLLSIQPTGNTSIFANVVSGGLEPVFLHEYIRTVIVNTMPDEIADVCPKWYEGAWHETEMFKFTKEGDEEILRGVAADGTVYKIDKNRGLTKEVLCEDYGVRVMKELGEWDATADWSATAMSMTVQDHVNDLKGFARWVDSAMSKTVNVPNDYPFEAFKNIYLDAYQSGVVKGVTTYRAGTMTTVLAAKDESDPDTEEEIILEDVKLPDSAPATMKTLKAEGRKWYLTVLWWDYEKSRPFGFFVHTNHYEKGTLATDAVDRLLDLARSKNIPLRHIEKVQEKINADNNTTKVARLISLCLRHGVLIRNIVATLDNVDNAYVGSFVFAIKKYLASFIKDGEKVEGKICDACGSANIVYSEGCMKCADCGSSKCG